MKTIIRQKYYIKNNKILHENCNIINWMLRALTYEKFYIVWVFLRIIFGSVKR